MSDELEASARFVVARLGADAALAALIGANNIHEGVAPPSATWPCVVFQAIPAFDTVGNFGTRVMTKLVYRVRGISQGTDMTALAAISARIDAALHKATGTYVGMYCESLRERALSYPEVSSGVTYRHRGGEYAINVHPA